MIEKIRYFLKEGFRSVWINRMMSLASVIVLGICLIMLGTTFLASKNINNILSELESKNQIMVFFDKSVTQDQITKAGDTINALPNVSSSKFLSKEDIFNQAKQELGTQDKFLLTGLDSSAFDCAYQVQIKSSAKYAQTVASLTKISGVKKVRQDIQFANMLTNMSRVVSLTGFWLFIIMAVISLFLIANTIKLTLFSRKREINIMKYVGATDWFIRWPFVIEGIILGIISGGVGLIAQWYIYNKVIAGVMNALKLAQPVSYGTLVRFVVPGFLLAGALVGALGSAVSVRKYLKV